MDCLWCSGWITQGQQGKADRGVSWQSLNTNLSEETELNFAFKDFKADKEFDAAAFELPAGSS